MEKQNNDIEKLFKEKLENLEIDPDKNSWSNIKAGLGAAATGAAASQAISSTSWTASIIAGTIITITAVGGYFIFDNQGAQQKHNNQQVEQTIEPSFSDGAIQENEAAPFSQEVHDIISSNLSEDKAGISSDRKTTINDSEAELSSSTNHDQLLSSRKTIEELAVDSQAQFEANLLEAIRLEEAERVASVKQKIKKSNQIAYSDSDTKTNSTSNADNDENYINQIIEFPVSFTPNFDGINDVFSLGEQYHDKIDNIAVYIYSSSKTIIHEWKGLSGSWDGNLNLSDGSLAPEGTYFYNAIITKDKVHYRVTGHVSLKR